MLCGTKDLSELYGEEQNSALVGNVTWSVRPSISSFVTAQTEVPDSQVNTYILGTSVLKSGTSHVLHFFIPVYINIINKYLCSPFRVF
jgi:hypothetical protein